MLEHVSAFKSQKSKTFPAQVLRENRFWLDIILKLIMGRLVFNLLLLEIEILMLVLNNLGFIVLYFINYPLERLYLLLLDLHHINKTFFHLKSILRSKGECSFQQCRELLGFYILQKPSNELLSFSL